MTQLSDKLEFFGFKAGMIQFLDGSVGGMIAVQPLSVESADNDTLNAASGQIKAFLSAVPEETMLQFVVALDHTATTSRAEGGSTTTDLAAELLTAREEWTSGLAKQGLLPSKRTLVLFRCPAQSTSKGKGLWQSTRARKAAYSNSLTQAWQRAKRTRDTLVEELDRLGCAPEVLSDLSVFESLVQFWNPESTQTIQAASFSPTRAAVSVINSDLVRDNQGFRIGKVCHRVISLKALPELTYPSLGARLEELPIGTSLHMSVEVPDQKKEISSLQTQRRVAYSLVAGKRSGVSDLESQAKFHDVEQLLDQMLTEGEKVLRLSLQIVVRDTDQHALEDKVAEALSIVREIAGAEAMIEDIASLEVFSALSLPNARCKERQHRIKSSNVADLLPLVGTWQGHGSDPESVSLRNRRGCLVNINPFDAGLTNANMLISGGSGAGKSYLTSVLMMQLLAKSKTPPKVIFVDVGGSYDRLCRLMGGYSVEFSLNADAPRINPFELPAGQTCPNAPKVRFLIGLVELMTKEPGEIGLPRLEKTVLEQCILALYKETGTPTLGDLCRAMKHHSHSGVNSRGLVLESWCGDSAYGALLDGPSTVDLSGSPIAFDLKGLDGHPELQAVMLQIITDLIWRKVQANRSEKKIVVFDECWKLLKDASGQILIEESFRTFRKYQASAIAISQDIADFASSPIAAALISNCSLKWLLKQGQVDEERLAKVLNLNPNELALVRSLEQKRGHFAESFLMAGEHHSVVSIESTPLEHWLATTHAPDLTLIEQEKQRNVGVSELELIGRLSRQYPRGALSNTAKQEVHS